MKNQGKNDKVENRHFSAAKTLTKLVPIEYCNKNRHKNTRLSLREPKNMPKVPFLKPFYPVFT